jgi:hypothetical protein
MQMMVRMQFHLLPEVHSALQRRAHEEGLSASELVRQGVEMRLGQAQGGEFRIVNRRLDRSAASAPAPGIGAAPAAAVPSVAVASSNGDSDGQIEPA